MPNETIENKNILNFSTGFEIMGGATSTMDTAPMKLEIMNSKQFFDGLEKHSFTDEMLSQIVNNFKNNILGRKVAVNYDHPRSRLASTRAAGWIGALNLGKNTAGDMAIFADIEWNEAGKKSVISKEFLYTSIGMYINMIDPRDGETKHGAVLFELTLTNDPANINLEAIINHKKEGETMANDNTDAKLKELESKFDGKIKSLENSNLELQKKLDTANSENEKLKQESEAKAKELELSKREVELESLVKNKAITPAMKEQAMTLTKDGLKGFLLSVDANKKAYETESANPTETTKADKMDDDGDSAEEKINKLVLSARKENAKLTYTEAFNNVTSSNPKLYQKFMDERDKNLNKEVQ